MARATTVLIVFFLVFIVGGTLLQIFLSKRESKWPGLVLPTITFLWSLLMVLNVTAMETMKAVIASVLSTLIAGNIPTFILLAIYFTCRGKQKKKNEVEKMQINDL